MVGYSTRNRLEKTAKGEARHTWATNTAALVDRIDESLDGATSFALSGSKTLTTTSAQPGTTDEARKRVLWITSGTGGTVTLPAVEKVYLIKNDATGAVTFTLGSGTTCQVGALRSAWIYSNGTNTYNVGHLDTQWQSLSTTAAASGTGSTITIDPTNFTRWRVIGGSLQQSSGSGRDLQVTVKRGVTTLLAHTIVSGTTSGVPYNAFVEIEHSPKLLRMTSFGGTAASAGSAAVVNGYAIDVSTPFLPTTLEFGYSVSTNWSNVSGNLYLEGR